MLGGDRFDVDLEIAHDALDDVATQPVVCGHRHPADGREAIGLDLPRVGGGGRSVLDIALRQRTDRARAEPDQRRRSVGRIALEAALEPPRRRRAGQRVARQGIMIKADRDIAAFLGEHAVDGVELGVALDRAGATAPPGSGSLHPGRLEGYIFWTELERKQRVIPLAQRRRLPCARRSAPWPL